MQKSHPTEIAIIGGGLTGLLLAHQLQKQSLKFSIIEARNRLGGRIHTHRTTGKASIEMGATWLGLKHEALVSLLEELGLDIFEQRIGRRAIYEYLSTSPHQLVSIPPNEEPSYRIKGGTSKLIETLAASIPSEFLFLGEQVLSIQQENEGILLKTNKQEILASKVVSTLPPYLLHKTIDIHPSLPDDLVQVMQQTHTWMGESIKVGLRFETPFWRTEGSSGTIFSNVGPISEFYDHSDAADQSYALKGFFNGSYFPLKKEERLAMVLKQLRKYYGTKVDDYIEYEETVWRDEAFSFQPYQSQVMPHQNNGHPLYGQLYWDGKLFIAGAETSAGFGGYMEGAVRSANRVITQLSLG